MTGIEICAGFVVGSLLGYIYRDVRAHLKASKSARQAQEAAPADTRQKGL